MFTVSGLANCITTKCHVPLLLGIKTDKAFAIHLSYRFNEHNLIPLVHKWQHDLM